MHAPALAVVVVERAVLGAAVVPDRQGADLPAEAAGELRLHRMGPQEIDDRPRLGVLEAVERCLLYTSPSPRDGLLSRMPSSA